MNKKRACIIAVVAFISLIRPCANALSFVDVLWWWLMGGFETLPPYYRLMLAVSSAFGMGAARWASVVIGWGVAAIPAVLIYRYLRRRDFEKICNDCAAHGMFAWTLLALFLLFSFTSCSRMFLPVTANGEVVPCDDATTQDSSLSLEFCLCHPDSEKLVRDLCETGKPIEEHLSDAPAIEGYRLLPLMNGMEVSDADYVSEKVELSEADVDSASVHRNVMDGAKRELYEVHVKLNEEGERKMRALTRDYMPCGAKNPSEHGRRLAIIVNGRLVVAPTIFSEIGKDVVITGNFTKDEAVLLAFAINNRNKSAQNAKQ